MNLFVYSDESGVFDKAHNEIYVYGGVIFLGKDSKEEYIRRYSAVEKVIRQSGGYPDRFELKACAIKNKEKSKLYRALNNCIKFGVVIHQEFVLDRIFESKKDKQRYLDYAYKIGLKKSFEALIAEGVIRTNEIDNIYIFSDEHTTATNGRYELREGLEQEFKNGTYNWTYDKFFPPIFVDLKSIDLQLCNSSGNYLIRAADIVANHIYHRAIIGDSTLYEKGNLYVYDLP